MNDGLVSVIVPVYNSQEFLEQCVDSLINSNYKNLEIILIDDGSTDRSGIICDNFAKLDKRIKVIHKSNGGASSSRNMGIDISHGDYISFLDSDDWIEPDKYCKLISLLRKYDVNISCCETRRSNQNYKTEDIYDEYIDKYNSIRNSLIPIKVFNNVWDKLFKSSVFENIRFEIGSFAEDTPVVYEALHNFGGVAYTNERLQNYRIHDNSITTIKFNKNKMTHIKMFNELIDRISVEYPDLQKLAHKTYIKTLILYFKRTSQLSYYWKFKNEHKIIVLNAQKIANKFSLFNSEIKIKDRITFITIKYFPALSTIIYLLLSGTRTKRKNEN